MHKYNLMGSYQPKSWACLLAGYGVFPQNNTKLKVDYSMYKQEAEGLNDFIRRCGLNFKAHSELLR